MPVSNVGEQHGGCEAAGIEDSAASQRRFAGSPQVCDVFAAGELLFKSPGKGAVGAGGGEAKAHVFGGVFMVAGAIRKRWWMRVRFK